MITPDYLFSGFIGAVIGALLGGFATAWGSYLFTKKHTKELEDKKIKNFAGAIYTELTALKERYMKIAGNLIEQTNIENELPLVGILSTDQNYFIVFDNLSSDLFGLLDIEMAKNVIDAYINTKALFDELVNLGNQWNSFHSLLKESILIRYDEYIKCVDDKKLANENIGIAIKIDELKNLFARQGKTFAATSYFKGDPNYLITQIIGSGKYIIKRHTEVISLVDKATNGLCKKYLKIYP
jgi:hypothetical protein